jgi:multidrug efflux pump subunit AcrA (membrane-fusion protein)
VNKKYLWNKKLSLIVLPALGIGFIFLLMQPDKGETSPEIEPIALVSVVKAKPQLIAKSMTVNGSINFVPEAMWQIYSPSEVIVDQILVHNGETIKKGQQLIKLRLSPTSEANLNNALQSVDFAQKDYERLQMLRSKYLASNAEVQTAQQALLKAEADYHSFKSIKGL